MDPLPAPGRTLVMAVLNVTPDSFSDGGHWYDERDGAGSRTRSGRSAAVRHGLQLAADGADLVDVGGESTRPGATRVDGPEEWRRIGPVIEALAGAGVTVSVDTMWAATARRAVAAGAALVNDVSGGLADPDMLATVAALGVPYVCMHWRAHAEQMASRARYADVVAEVVAELGDRLAAAVAAGIEPSRIVLDPGIGFAKNAEHNWQLLARLPELAALGRPLLIGVSRKSFLGSLLAAEGPADGGSAAAAGPVPRPPSERDDASVALTTLLAAAGVWGVRVHTARSHRDAVAVAQRWTAGLRWSDIL